LVSAGADRRVRLRRRCSARAHGRCLLAAEARAQRFHQVDDLPARRLGSGRLGNLVAGDLPIDRAEDALLLLVDEGGGIVVVGGDLADQLQREAQLGLLDIDLLDVEVLHRTDLVGVQQLLQHDAVVVGADLARRIPCPSRPSARGHSGHSRAWLRAEAVRLRAALVGGEVVGLVVVDRVDCAERDEATMSIV
jgi:hypothetical protein